MDPHAWLDPENGKVWLAAIADALAAADPDHADAYRANAAAGASEIDAAAAEAAPSSLDTPGLPPAIPGPETRASSRI